jgi:hypothetical protein
LIHLGDAQSWALFSDEMRYRYELGRCWSPNLPTMLVAGLNPSTADHLVNDPTIRRCIGFAVREGCGTLLMVNAFAWRATDPDEMIRELFRGHYIVGPENDAAIVDARKRADIRVAAWGKPAKALRPRLAKALFTSEPWQAFKLTDDGAWPRHPLYLRADAGLMNFR